MPGHWHGLHCRMLWVLKVSSGSRDIGPFASGYAQATTMGHLGPVQAVTLAQVQIDPCRWIRSVSGLNVPCATNVPVPPIPPLSQAQSFQGISHHHPPWVLFHLAPAIFFSHAGLNFLWQVFIQLAPLTGVHICHTLDQGFSNFSGVILPRSVLVGKGGI